MVFKQFLFFYFQVKKCLKIPKLINSRLMKKIKILIMYYTYFNFNFNVGDAVYADG